jgi:hypothetical protein
MKQGSVLLPRINKGVSMIRVEFGPISETVYIDIILNTIIERYKKNIFFYDFTLSFVA